MRDTIFGNDYTIAIPRFSQDIDKSWDVNCGSVLMSVGSGEYSR